MASSSSVETILLNREQSLLIADCIALGRYPSPSEVVTASLRLLADEEKRRDAAVYSVRQMIELGARQLDRNEDVDGEAVFQRLRERRERLRRESADA